MACEVVGTAAEEVGPLADQSLDNLDADAVAMLRQLPGVVEVVRHGPEGRPSSRIVHLLDWHYVARSTYSADLRSQSAEPIWDEEIDRAWEEHLHQVAAVQREQMLFLRHLVRRHGLRRVYIEGLTERDVPTFQAKIAALRKIKADLDGLRGLLEEEDGRLLTHLESLEREFRRDSLQLGAAGRMLMDGTIEAVLPLEDPDTYEAANPVAEDGTVALDQERIAAREEAQAKRLLSSGRFCLIVLGGAHDLADNLDRLSDGRAEYIRVGMRAWREVGERAGR
jgi:hypothetical protein